MDRNLQDSLKETNPVILQNALYSIWRSRLSIEDQSLIDQIREININETLNPSEAFQAYNQLRTSWTGEKVLRAAGLWHQLIDITRMAHFFAHHNGLEANIEAEGFDGQSIRGAVARAFENGANTAKDWDKIKGKQQISIPTPHPTETTNSAYTASLRKLRETLADFLLSPGDKTRIQKLNDAISHFSGITTIIPDRKLSSLEEGAIGFTYIANGLLASATAGKETIDALSDTGRRKKVRLLENEPQIADYMLSGVGDWTLADADGNPLRTADVTHQGVEDDFDRIREWLADQIETCLGRTSRKTVLQILATSLREKEYDFTNDPEGTALADRLLDASATQTGEVRDHLRKLEAIVRKRGWFWRRGDIRQSSEIHRAIAEQLNQCQTNGQDNLEQAVIALRQDIAQEEDEEKRKKSQVFLDTILRLKTVKQYPDAFRQYIISNYSGANDAGDLYRLLKAGNVHKGLQFCFLHETAADLVNAPRYLRELSNALWFEDYLENNNYTLTIKIAMSDSQRESGPGAYFLQLHSSVESFLEVMRINRLRTAQGLKPLKMDLQFGGADDYTRGGNDITSYYFEFARSVKGAASLNGFNQDEIRAAMGDNISATIQGRQRNHTLGDIHSAEITMERMAACVVNFYGFINRDHSPEELNSFREEYKANKKAKDLLLPLLVPAYQAIAGELLNEIGLMGTSWETVRGLNTGCRPDSRPVFNGKDGDVDLERACGLQRSKTRAITAKFGDQISGTNQAGWFALNVLAQIPLKTRQKLYKTSPHFRDFVFRPVLILAHTHFDRFWHNSNLPEPFFCKKKMYADAFHHAFKEKRLQQTGDTYAMPLMKKEELHQIITSVLSVLGLPDNKENRRIVIASWDEIQKMETERVIIETINGVDYGIQAKAANMLKSFPSHYGTEIKKSNAARRIGMEIETLDRLAKPFYAWLADTMQANRTKFTPREEYTNHERLMVTCGSGIVTACQTPSAFTHVGEANGDLHLSYTKRAAGEYPLRLKHYKKLPPLPVLAV